MTAVRSTGWLLLMTAAVVCASCDKASPPPQASSTATVAANAKALPRIDLDGFHKLIDEAKQNKQVLVVDFWATWCDPCVELFPDLHDRMAKLGPRVRLVSVTLDAPGHFEASAVDFLDKNHATHDAFLLVPDTDARLNIIKQLGKRWQDEVVPAILVYGPDGKLAGEYLEATAHADLVADGVSCLLSPGAASQP